MSILSTKRLIISAAKQKQRRIRRIPHKEIAKRLVKLKKLAAQKAPPLAVKKELIGLERRLRGVFHLEKKLLVEEKKEKEEISSLKRQVIHLKKLAEDKELQHKVDKISFLIGDLMAKHETERDIESKKIIQQAIKMQQEKLIEQPLDQRIIILQQKLEALKAAGEITPEQIKLFEQRITKLKEKLSKEPIKHKMMLKPESEQVTN